MRLYKYALALMMISFTNCVKAEEPEHLQEDGSSQESGHRALLLLHQQILNEYGGEKENMTMKYSAINVGLAPANDVKIYMPNWPSDMFDIVEGSPVAVTQTIEPGQVFAYEFTVKPRESFMLSSEDTMAHVEYRYGKDETDIGEKVGKTPGIPDYEILTYEKYMRLTATFMHEWTLFGLLSASTWILPFGVWLSKSARS